MMQSQSYLIDSLAPLVFRSGRPFGSQVGQEDVNFPMPSRAAGLVRTQYLQQQGWLLNQQDPTSERGRLSAEDKQKLQQIQSRGPYLVRVSDVDGAVTVLLPKPADALYLQAPNSSERQLVRLSPHNGDDAQNSGCDLPEGLLPVVMEQAIKGKPKGGPAFWSVQDLWAWQQGQDLDFETVNRQGASSMPVELRTHVKIESRSWAAEEGKLFQTAAYDLGNAKKPHHAGWEEAHYGFLVQSEVMLNDDLAKFGGEGRLSHFKQTQAISVFECPTDLASNIERAGGLRLTLLSPAIFSGGYLPGWLNPTSKEGVLPHSQVKVRLRAVAMDRWLPVSGWDLDQNKPKAMRKAVAAGAVYWFELLEGSAQTIENSIFNSISDDAQDQRDGFGIVGISHWQAQ